MIDEHEKTVAAFIISLLKLNYSTPEMVASFLMEERRAIENTRRLDDGFIMSLNRENHSDATQNLAVALHDSLVFGHFSWKELETEASETIELLSEQGIHILHPFCTLYPKRLLRNRAYPPILYCKGNLSAVESEKMVAIIGSNSLTKFGARMALRFAQIMSEDGYITVIEYKPAIGCMHNLGVSNRSVAIFRTPIDEASLTESGKQFSNDLILAGGAIMSEYAPGTIPHVRSNSEGAVVPWELLEGIADGVVATEISLHDRSWIVIEQAIKSDTPVEVFDYRPNERLRPTFEMDRRFGGNMLYLASRRGVSPIFGPETIEDFKARMGSYRVRGKQLTHGEGRSERGDHLLNETLELSKFLSRKANGTTTDQIGIDECARDLVLRIGYMLHGEDLAGKRLYHNHGNDLIKGTCGTCSWACDTEGLLFIYPTNGISGILAEPPLPSRWPWLDYKIERVYEINYADAITAVIIDEGVTAPCWLLYLFKGCGKLVFADLSKLDVSSVRMMASLFSGCHELIDINLSGWDISGIESLDSFFSGCSSLKMLDLTGWDTSGLNNLYSMFGGCQDLAYLDLSSWDTSHVRNMGHMFAGCHALKNIEISNWNVSSVLDMKYMFAECRSLSRLDLSTWNVSSVTVMQHMFSGCHALEDLDLRIWKTTKVKVTAGMFWECTSLASLDLSGWDTSSVVDMRYMFYGCSGLESLDISGWDTSNATEMSDMFTGCVGLMSITVGPTFDVTKAFPNPTSDNGKWWSRTDGRWYTVDEIRSGRFGIADTYENRARNST